MSNTLFHGKEDAIISFPGKVNSLHGKLVQTKAILSGGHTFFS